MHPHRPDAGDARRTHTRDARLADVGTQPTPRRIGNRRGGVGGDNNLAYGMRGGNLPLLRCGRKAHIGNGNLRRNEAFDRLFGSVGRLTGSEVRR